MNKIKFGKVNKSSFFLAVFSVLCSLVLWIYVTGSEGVEVNEPYSGIEVVFQGEDNMRDSKGLIITEFDTTSVSVDISGPRNVISALDAADIKAVIDLSTISGANVYSIAYRLTYPSGFDASKVTVTARYPQNITFTVDKLSTRNIEVFGQFNGSTAEGFIAEPLEFSPNTVKVTGPESVLEQIAHAWVEVIREDVDRSLTFDTNYVLRDVSGEIIESDDIQLVDSTVSVTLPVLATKDIDLSLNFVEGAGAKQSNVKYTIEPSSTITLSGAAETLQTINNIALDTIDLADIVDDTFTETYTIVIPNDTEILNGPKEVRVTVELRGLSRKTLSVSNLSYTSLRDGYSAEIINNSIDVVLRGTESALKNVSANNIRAVADLTEVGTATGVFNVPVKIYIDGTTDVGAVGDYKVYIKIDLETETNE